MRLSVARAGWLTIVSIVALIALIAAYDERTRVPLLGTILLVYVVQVVSYATVGTGITNALATGTANGGLPVGEATTAAASGLGTIVILVSLGFLLARPYADSPLLELDPSVDRTLASAGERLGSPRLVDAQPVRLGGFILRSMDAGARTATPVVIAVAAAGVIPGVISVSGLGPNLTSLIVQTAGGSLLALLLLTGVSAIILGLGMPTTVMYIILVAMLGPAIEVFGIALLAAHLFILYFGLMADVTPPVAVAAYAAAGVAKADEFATGIIAFLLSLNKILVPFAFVFSPGILLLRITDEGPRILGWSDVAALGYFVPEVVIPIVGMFLGVYALGVTIIGYYRAEISDVHRGLFAIASILLMVPALFLVAGDSLFGFFGIGTPLYTVFNDVLARGVGLVMLVTLLYVNRHGAERAESSAEATPQAE